MLDHQEWPDHVGEAVALFVQASVSAFGENLRSIILFGSAAEGRLRMTSDVNLLVVLRRFEALHADALREPFGTASAAASVSAMFILEDELQAAAQAFAQKFADIQRRHRVLFGDDVVASLDIGRAVLVARLQQVLLNLAIRTREMYIGRSLREEQCAATVAETAAPLRTVAASILELEGRAAASPKEALRLIVGELGRPDFEELLPHLSEARETRALPPGMGATFFFRTLELTRALYRRALSL